jgi:hypothetical protein
MNEQNEENLKELFEQFVDSEQPNEAAEDIRQGEGILRGHAAPEPDGKLIAQIKAEVAGELAGQKMRVTKRVVFRVAAVAAAFFVLAVVSVRLFETGPDEQRKIARASVLPSVIWESEDLAADDSDLATLSAQVDEVEDEALTLQFGDNGGNGRLKLAELEIELMEIDSDFWKG